MKKEVTNLNKKDELFNDLVKLFKTSRVDFSSTAVASSGSYFVQVLTNALWYITNDHLTINETTKQAKELTPILKLFEGYIGYYEIKRKKKVKVMPLSSDLLRSHAHALYSLLLKPYVKLTGSWKTISDGIRDLADCLNNYREYLNRKKADSRKYKSSLAPAKTLDENSTIKYLEPCQNLDETYENLDRGVREVGMNVRVVVKEGVHTVIFENNMQRPRFFERFHLSVQTDLVAFCPGGSETSIFAVVQVKEG